MGPKFADNDVRGGSRMNRTFVTPLTLALALAASASLTPLGALAQTAPSSTAAPATAPHAPSSHGDAWHTRQAPNPARALNQAYRIIGEAEARGAKGRWLDAARAHYKNALARNGRGEAGQAAAEAMASAALARASIAALGRPIPSDLPTPPAMIAHDGANDWHRSEAPVHPGMMGAMPMPAASGAPNPMMAMQMMHAQMMSQGGWMQHHAHPFDAAKVAADAKLAGTAEASDIAKAALDANVAAEHAAFDGKHDEAMRQRGIARSLAAAVRNLARAEHPQATQPRERRWPMDGNHADQTPHAI